MKNLIILFLLLGSAGSVYAQDVFSYGNHTVSRQEFLKAYNKNANGEKPSEQSYRDYLDLYSRFRLKVQAAYDKKMDTLPGQLAELQNFRNQVIEGFMQDDSSVNILVDEAFTRSRKDIRLAHIYIPFYTSPDTLAAYKKAMQAYRELNKGAAFSKVVTTYSADSSSFERGGEIGFITVFTLPYALENLAYSTAPGKFSAPYRSASGYHIFKNIEERTAIGKIVAAHIHLLFYPNIAEEKKAELRKRADSLYTALQQGAAFGELAEKFSDDNLTYQSGGQLPSFTPGTYDPAFEEQVFSAIDGSISKPLLMADGYHIIKRISLVPVNTSRDSTDSMAELTRRVKNDARMRVSKDVFVNKAYRITRLDKKTNDENKLLTYYKDHLEQYSPEFAAQIKEFKDGNLLFEIMQSSVWEKASNDSIGLKKYYDAHKEKYKWEPSADAILFICNDSATAISIRSAFSINTSSWRDIAQAHQGNTQADSGRYELPQLPLKDTASLKAGIITPLVDNSQEHTLSFVYIKKLYPGGQSRSFKDAKGFVLNDYQAELEEKWIAGLKKKYPVKVNEAVLKGL